VASDGSRLSQCQSLHRRLHRALRHRWVPRSLSDRVRLISSFPIHPDRTASRRVGQARCKARSRRSSSVRLCENFSSPCLRMSAGNARRKDAASSDSARIKSFTPRHSRNAGGSHTQLPARSGCAPVASSNAGKELRAGGVTVMRSSCPAPIRLPGRLRTSYASYAMISLITSP